MSKSRCHNDRKNKSRRQARARAYNEAEAMAWRQLWKSIPTMCWRHDARQEFKKTQETALAIEASFPENFPRGLREAFYEIMQEVCRKDLIIESKSHRTREGFVQFSIVGYQEYFNGEMIRRIPGDYVNVDLTVVPADVLLSMVDIDLCGDECDQPLPYLRNLERERIAHCEDCGRRSNFEWYVEKVMNIVEKFLKSGEFCPAPEKHYWRRPWRKMAGPTWGYTNRKLERQLRREIKERNR